MKVGLSIRSTIKSCYIRPYRMLVLLMLVGLTIRIVAAAHEGLSVRPVSGSDAAEYDSYARNLAQGHGYAGISPDVRTPEGQLLDHPTAFRVPGTSLFWAGLFRICGYRYRVVRISQCLLDTLSIALIFEIASACFTCGVALSAAALYTVWPTALIYSSQLGSEPLYAFLFYCFVLAMLKFAHLATWSRAIVAGLILGAAMLTRGNAIVMVTLLVIWSLWQFRHAPRLVVPSFAITFVALAALVPWTIRNYWILHSFVPFETGGGDVLLGSYNRITANDPEYYGYWVYPTSELPEYRAEITAPNDEVIRDHVEMRLAFRWIRNHPQRLFYLAWSRLRRAWTPFLQPRSPKVFRVGMLVSWGPVLILLVLGFIPSGAYFLLRNHPGWIIHLGIFHIVLTDLLFWGSSRFRYPVEGLCIIIASATLARLLKHLRESQRFDWHLISNARAASH